MRTIITLLFLSTVVRCYRIAIFTANFPPSQVIHYNRIAKALADVGHNVVVHSIVYINESIPKSIRWDNQVEVKANTPEMEQAWVKLKDDISKVIYLDVDNFDSRVHGILEDMLGLLRDGCKVLVSDKMLHHSMLISKFDLLIAPAFDVCPLGLAHIARIPAHIISSSVGLMDHIAIAARAPSPSSYVPPYFSTYTDIMTFSERIFSFLLARNTPSFVWKHVVDAETEIFREAIGPSFPDLYERFENSVFFFINSHELYDFPRPTMHRIVNIGGLGMTATENTEFGLREPFNSFMRDHNKVVIFSFGSFTDVTRMPSQWKDTFLSSFANFSDFEFILRYDGDDLNQRLPKNVHIFDWIPQTSLLNHPSVVGFISHGGSNSLQEALFAGKPIITIPLFADHFRNARIAERYGFGYYLPKSQINENNVKTALTAILLRRKYAESAVRLKEMVERLPISPERTVVKFAELAAEFKENLSLKPYAMKMGFIQYHSIDVIGFLFILSLVLVVLLYFIFKKILVPLVINLFRKQRSAHEQK